MTDQQTRKVQPPVGPWAADAACLNLDPGLFFAEGHDANATTRAAKKVCAGCAVAGDCLEYALRYAERYGVWGGKDERERRPLRKAWLARQATAAGVTITSRGSIAARCGTPSGYAKHRRNGEQACAECTAATKLYMAAYRAKTPRHLGALPAGSEAPKVAHLVSVPTAQSTSTEYDPDGVLDRPWYGGAA